MVQSEVPRLLMSVQVEITRRRCSTRDRPHVVEVEKEHAHENASHELAKEHGVERVMHKLERVSDRKRSLDEVVNNGRGGDDGDDLLSVESGELSLHKRDGVLESQDVGFGCSVSGNNVLVNGVVVFVVGVRYKVGKAVVVVVVLDSVLRLRLTLNQNSRRKKNRRRAREEEIEDGEQQRADCREHQK